jgi:hypothetical protein
LSSTLIVNCRPCRVSSHVRGKGKSQVKLKSFIVGVIVFLVSVCNPVARAGSLTTEAVSIFPANTTEFGFTDLQQARALSWFPALRSQVLPAQLWQFEQLLASPGMDPDSHVEGVAWGVVSSAAQQAPPSQGASAGGEMFVVALGQFSPESTDAYFRSTKLTVVKVRDYPLYPVSGSGSGDLFFSFMNSTVAVLGGRKELERVIGIRYGEEQSLLSNAELAPLIAEANGRSIVWGVLNAFPQSQALLSELRAFTLEIDADAAIRSRFEAVCASSGDADTFATLLRADQQYQRSAAGNTNQDMSGLLEQATVASSGDRLDVTLDLTDDQVAGLFQHNGFLTR